jgi:hypothetical protein
MTSCSFFGVMPVCEPDWIFPFLSRMAEAWRIGIDAYESGEVAGGYEMMGVSVGDTVRSRERDPHRRSWQRKRSISNAPPRLQSSALTNARRPGA